jgi:hypothetical protein
MHKTGAARFLSAPCDPNGIPASPRYRPRENAIPNELDQMKALNPKTQNDLEEEADFVQLL